MKIKTLIPATLLALALNATAQDLYYMHNGQRVPLTADPEAVLVREVPSPVAGKKQNTEQKLGVASADISRNGLPGWARVKASALGGKGTNLREKTTAATTKAEAPFVTPVLRKPDGSEMSPTQDILVIYREGRNPATVFASLKKTGLVSQAQIGQSGIWKIQTNLKDGYAVLDLANQLSAHPDLSHAAVDGILTLQASFRPTDPDYLGKSWGLRNAGQTVPRGPGWPSVTGVSGFDMQAEQAWDITKGAANVLVLVMDDGVDTSHPDLNLAGAADFTGTGQGGRHVNSFEGHGTMVAGCIAGKQNNARGSCGIAPVSRVLSAKTSVTKNEQGNFDLNPSAVVAALDWGFKQGARITNSSWGVGDSRFGDPTIDAAFLRYFQSGMIHFVSTGNSASDFSTIGWPSSLPSVVAVGAASPGGARTDFSQFGAAANGKGVDFLAPGDGIWTTDRLGAAGESTGDYVFIPGTSFASPYAAGVAALILAKNPGLTPSQIYSRLINGCRDMGAAGYDAQNGHGLISAYRALGGGAPADDHGDTLAAARVVAAPSTTNGVIGTGSDVDVFKFTLTAARTVVLRSQSSIDTLGEVFNSSGQSLGSSNDVNGTRDFGLQGNLNAGTYYVAVKGNGSSVTGSYQLVITATVITTPVMNVLGLSSRAIADNTSTISVAAGTDYGTVTTPGAVVRRSFTIRNTGNGPLVLSGSPVIALSGSTAASFRVAVLPASTLNAGASTTFAIDFAPASHGSSLAMVTITSNDSKTSPYQFLVGGSASFPVVSDDHGNTLASATSVSSYITSGRLERGGDQDVFRVTITGYGYLSVQTTGSTDTFGYLLNSAGATINYDDDAGSGSNFGIVQYVTPGTYYVVVKGYGSSTTGAYSLVFN